MVKEYKGKHTRSLKLVRVNNRLESKKCVACGRNTQAKFKPFCSQRCAQIDLGRWLNEDYRIPGEEISESDGFADDSYES